MKMNLDATVVDFAPSPREQIGDMHPVSNRLGGRLNRRPKFGAARDHLHQNNHGFFDLKAVEIGLGVEFSVISLPLPSGTNTNTNPNSREESLQTESTSTTPDSSRPIANNYIMCRTQDETRRSTPSQSQRKKKDLSSSADDNTQIRIASNKPCETVAKKR